VPTPRILDSTLPDAPIFRLYSWKLHEHEADKISSCCCFSTIPVPYMRYAGTTGTNMQLWAERS
jgi:hypothetical protein